MPTAPRGLIQGEWISQPGVSRRSRSTSQPLQLTTCQDRQSTFAAEAICIPTDLFRELAAPSTFSIRRPVLRLFLVFIRQITHHMRPTIQILLRETSVATPAT